ncbi:MAG: hypothetical protein LBP42_01370, partial [Treponema sp.]|nr:hypothetical protein [Treponema sp.]
MKRNSAVFKPGLWTVLWGAIMLITAGCPMPIGDNYEIPTTGRASYVSGYNLQTYVPVPVAGERPVTQVTNRADMDIRVMWKNEAGE